MNYYIIELKKHGKTVIVTFVDTPLPHKTTYLVAFKCTTEHDRFWQIND